MKVKFVRDARDQVFNFDGLTKGHVYDVIAVSHKDRHLLKIQNDNNYVRYYHKDLFIEVYEDAENNILSYLSENSVNKLSKESCEEYKKCIEDIGKVYDILMKYRGVINDNDMDIIAECFKLYPEVVHDLITNLLDTRCYVVDVHVTKDTLKRYKGKKYKLTNKGPVMILHGNEEYLIGKKILFKNL